MNAALVIVLNPFLHDSRVLRQVEALVGRGYSTTVFALHEPDLPTHEVRVGYRLRRFQLITRPWPKAKIVQGIKYLECIARMIWAGVRLKPRLIQANDMDALPIGYLIAKIAKSKLLYDSHELWSDVTRSELPSYLFKTGRAVETFLARRADAVITVNEKIARTMATEMKIALPAVVRNVPKCASNLLEVGALGLRKSLGVSNESPIILYIGGLASGRGLETLIDAMAFVHRPTVAAFVGPHQSTEYLEKLKSRILNANLVDRVWLRPPVPPNEVAHYASDATIGVCPIEDTGLSYRYCLPNKLFECLNAGLPVVVTDLPEMSILVRRYGVGETFPDHDPKALARTLNHILSSPALLAQYRANAAAAAKELTWSNEEPKLLEIYDNLCPLNGYHAPDPQGQ